MDHPDEEAEKMDSQPNRRHLIRFNPEVNSGTLIQIGVIIFGFATASFAVVVDREKTNIRLGQVESNALAEAGRVKESLVEIKGDLRDLQRTVNEVNQSLATMKAAPK